MSDNTATPELTDEDLAAIQASLNEGSNGLTHSVLTVWRELFSNIPKVSKERVTPGLAMNIVSTWPKISIQETPRYHEYYHIYLAEAADIVEAALPEDAEKQAAALAFTGEDDARENEAIYLEILLQWQLKVMEWEAEWDAAHEDAHITAAVIADVHKFLLSGTGIVEHLSAINFRYTDEAKAEHAKLMEEYVTELEARHG